MESLIYLGDSTTSCPYLADKVATLRFGDGLLAAGSYRQLLDAGYRRNGLFVYRPVCAQCNACKVLRVPVAEFRPSRDQRRAWRRCHGRFEIVVTPPETTEEKAGIYRRYLAAQHGNTNPDDDAAHYEEFLAATCLGGQTLELQLRHDGQLAGLGILDRLHDVLSSVYFYYDPDFSAYSLGTYSALVEIELARKLGLAYYYLGYYIAECRSMVYKARFRPCEIKDSDADTWTRLD